MSKTTTADTADNKENDETAGWYITDRDEEIHNIPDNDPDDSLGFRGFPEIYQSRQNAEAAAMELANRKHPNEDLEVHSAYKHLILGLHEEYTAIKNADGMILYSIVQVEYSE